MATTTPNYGWAVPTSTDLVKDGATAIETLGDAIDASMNTALGTKKAGMVLLNTTSFSGVASQSFPASVFSSTYTNYVLQFDVTTSGADEVNLRLRASGTDAITNYNFQFLRGVSTSAAAGANASLDRHVLTTNGFAGRHFGEANIFQPNVAIATGIVGKTFNGTTAVMLTSALHTTASAYDSATIYPGAGTITGNIAIFGVAK